AIEAPVLAVLEHEQPEIALVGADLEGSRPGAFEPWQGVAGSARLAGAAGIHSGAALAARAIAATGGKRQRGGGRQAQDLHSCSDCVHLPSPDSLPADDRASSALAASAGRQPVQGSGSPTTRATRKAWPPASSRAPA